MHRTKSYINTLSIVFIFGFIGSGANERVVRAETHVPERTEYHASTMAEMRQLRISEQLPLKLAPEKPPSATDFRNTSTYNLNSGFSTTEGLLEGRNIEQVRTKISALAVGPRVKIYTKSGKELKPADIVSGQYANASVTVVARENGNTFTAKIEPQAETMKLGTTLKNVTDERFSPQDTGAAAKGVWGLRPDNPTPAGTFGIRGAIRSAYYYGNSLFNLLTRQEGGNAEWIAADVYYMKDDAVLGGGGPGGGMGKNKGAQSMKGQAKAQ